MSLDIKLLKDSISKRIFVTDKNRLIGVLLLVLIAYYIFLQIFFIKLPGLNCDEAKLAAGALFSEEFPSVNFFNRKFIVMHNEYHGALEIYINLLFTHLFGFNVVSLRLIGIFFSLIEILIVYLFSKRFFNKQIAYMTVCLLVTSVIFLRTSKIGAGYAPVATTLFLGALFCFSKWYYENKIRYFYLSSFLMGLGLNSRAHFLWFIIAALILVLVFNKDIRRAILKSKRNFFFAYLLGGILTFSLGLSLILVYNIATNFTTLRYIRDHFFLTKCGIDNSQYINNLLPALKSLYRGLKGYVFKDEFFSGNTDFTNNNYFFWVLVFCLAWLFFIIFSKRKILFRKKIVFLMLLIFIIFLMSPFTLSIISSHYYLPAILPFIQLMISLSFFYLFIIFKNKLIRVSIVIFFISMLLTNLIFVCRYNDFLKKTGGMATYSDAIYNLADWLIHESNLRVVALDWGMYYNLLFLTKGKIDPVRFRYIQELIDENEFTNDLRKEFNNRDNVYVFHSPKYTQRDVLNIFKDMAEEEKKEIFVEQEFYQRDGDPVFIVYSLREKFY